jgi:glutamyl-tRNA reductase
VPRDLDPDIGRITGCYLYDIDDLQGVVAANRHEREREVAQAERIVDEEVGRMNDWLAGLEVVPAIAQLRGKLAELSPAQRDQVEQLTTAIVNKILHLPTVRLKELAAERDAYVYVEALRRLFDLDGAAAVPAGEPGESAQPPSRRAGQAQSKATLRPSPSPGASGQ